MSIRARASAAIAGARRRAGELARFGAVGLAGIVVNLGVFNLLRLGPLAPSATVAGDSDRVVTAKVIATAVSVAFAWALHRGWTFRGRRRHTPVREAVIFAAINAVAIAIEAGLVALTHHGFGWTSALADNLSSLVGIGIGTAARYVGFSTFVFSRGGTDAHGAPPPRPDGSGTPD